MPIDAETEGIPMKRLLPLCLLLIACLNGCGGSAEYDQGEKAGLKFGSELAQTLHSTGDLVSQADFQEMIEGVEEFDCPFPRGSSNAKAWMEGFKDGAKTSLGNKLNSR